MKKTELVALCLSIGLISTGCSKEEETVTITPPSTDSNFSSNNATSNQGGGGILGGMTGESPTSADEMRLEDYTGSITLQNQLVEKAVVLGSRLVTGDNIETMVESNAFVVLDASKLLRVNEISQVEIVQEDKHLDIFLSKGTLFFNVNATLSGEESLEFHTNNVVTGVRGTSGIIHFDPVEQVTQIVVLTGVVSGVTNSEEQTIEAGQVAIVKTLEDGTAEMTIYELDEEDPIYYFPDHFIDGIQGDLNNEGESVPLSEMVREPNEVNIVGKVLSISSVLGVEDENGKLHTIDNSSGQSWEGVTLGGMVNLTYSGNTVTAIQQTSQEPDVVGAYVDSRLYYSYNYYAEPYGQWESTDSSTIYFFDVSNISDLSDAEKEMLLLRIKSAYATEMDYRFGTWEDVENYASQNGIPLMYSEQGFPYYNGLSWREIFTMDSATEGKITIGDSTKGGMTEYTATLNPSTGKYAIQVTGGAG